MYGDLCVGLRRSPLRNRIFERDSDFKTKEMLKSTLSCVLGISVSWRFVRLAFAYYFQGKTNRIDVCTPLFELCFHGNIRIMGFLCVFKQLKRLEI